MSDAPVVIAPPPFKDRRSWLIVFGVFEILIGCLLLAMIALAVVGMRLSSKVPSAPPPNPGAIATMAAFYAALAVVFVTVGIGSIQARRWARIAMLIISWCWLAFGVLGTAMMALVMPMILENVKQQSQTPMPPGFEVGMRVAMLLFMGIFLVVLPLVFVVFYSGKNVKATFNAASSKIDGTPRKPVPVIIVVVWFALGAFTTLAVLQHPAFPFLGFIVVGWKAFLVTGLSSVISIWLAWNLYQQRRIAWQAAVAWIIFNWVSMLITLSRYGLLEMYRRMGYSEIELSRMVPFVTYAVYFGWALGIAFFVFLIMIRKYFQDSASVPAMTT